jgi:hypothetical protein
VTIAIVAALSRLMIRYPWPAQSRSLREIMSGSRFGYEAVIAFVWIVIGVLGSFGEHGFLHPFLFRTLHVFRATRTPARWAMIAYVGLAVWAAIGASALLRRVRPRNIVAALLLIAATVEMIPRVEWTFVSPEVAPVHAWLARTRPGVTLELPLHGGGMPVRYVLASAAHRVPIMNGTSAWEPPLHEFLRKKEERLSFDDEFLTAIANAGCTTLIVHGELLRDERDAIAVWLRANIERGRLQHVAQFGRDDVYTLSR